MNKLNKTTIGMMCILILSLSGPAIAGSMKKKRCKGNFFKCKAKSVSKLAKEVGKTIGETPGNIIREGGKGAENLGREANVAGDNVERAAVDTIHDIGNTFGKAGDDAAKTIKKAGDDTVAEVGRAGKNLEDAAVAIRVYTERQLEGTVKTLTDAEKRIREGKVLDALYHLAVDPQLNTEENLAKATQESKLLNTVGQTAASAYGGPGGAAAYAAWSTYRKTGDADLAMRVGIITGLSNKAFAVAGKIQTIGTDGKLIVDELAKKAVVTGAIGGLAVAASGGDEAAVRDAFLLSGGMVLVQDGYKRVTTHDLNAKGAKGEPYCMLANPGANVDCAPPKEAYVKDENGKLVADVRKVDPARPHVGLMVKPGDSSLLAKVAGETSPVMTGVSRIPGMNAMALFHDHWAVSWEMSPVTNVATIFPAVVLTYMGTTSPINDHIQDVNVEAAKKDNMPQPLGVTAASTSKDESTSFLCVKGELSRTIFIATGTDKTDFACVVVYQKDKELKEDLAPWYAVNDKDYCKIPAAKLAQDHVEWGWSCFAR